MVVQVPYNVITRSIDEECVAFCKKMGIGMTMYNPLAGGLLTGKHSRDAGPIEGTRFDLNKEYHERFWQDANFDALEDLKKIAEGARRSMTELAFQWIASQEHVDSIIVGATKMAHLEQNIAAADDKLDDATLEACDAVWQRVRGGHFRYNR